MLITIRVSKVLRYVYPRAWVLENTWSVQCLTSKARKGDMFLSSRSWGDRQVDHWASLVSQPNLTGKFQAREPAPLPQAVHSA